mmetsp:Transcript_7791/g.18191  ORF Transcript_7791/g.18191 Transcript_7791/m.18191 type:complete len:256 (-) Transcript_7791:877-1644(-)
MARLLGCLVAHIPTEAPPRERVHLVRVVLDAPVRLVHVQRRQVDVVGHVAVVAVVGAAAHAHHLLPALLHVAAYSGDVRAQLDERKHVLQVLEVILVRPISRAGGLLTVGLGVGLVLRIGGLRRARRCRYVSRLAATAVDAAEKHGGRDGSGWLLALRRARGQRSRGQRRGRRVVDNFHRRRCLAVRTISAAAVSSGASSSGGSSHGGAGGALVGGSLVEGLVEGRRAPLRRRPRHRRSCHRLSRAEPLRRRLEL